MLLESKTFYETQIWTPNLSLVKGKSVVKRQKDTMIKNWLFNNKVKILYY